MECEDTAAALFEHENGALASLQATRSAYPCFAECIELNFSKGGTTLASGLLKTHFINATRIGHSANEASGGGADPMAFDHATHRAVLQDFVTAVKIGREPVASERSALIAQQVTEAIVASSASGATVVL